MREGYRVLLVYFTFSTLGGILASRSENQLYTGLILIAGVFAGLFYLKRKNIGAVQQTVIFGLVFVVFFFSFFKAGNSEELNNYYNKLTGEERVFYGEITGAKTSGENLAHFPLEILKVDDKKLKKAITVRMSINTSQIEGKNTYFPGDTLEVKGSLEEVPFATNPGEFDYKEYLATREKDFLIYPKEINKLDEGFNFFRYGSIAAEYMKKTLENKLSPAAFGWVNAVTFGDRSHLREIDEVNLNEAGGGHIAAVSGMHLSIIGMGFFSFFLKRGFHKRYASFITLAVIWFYISMVGARPSVLRAGIMLSIFLLAEGYGRKKLSFSTFDSLLFAFNFLLLVSPEYLFNIGFQLSFSATFFILLLYPFFNGKLKFEPLNSSNLNHSEHNLNSKTFVWKDFNFILEPVKVSCAALVGVFPLLIYYFGYASGGSLLISPFIAIILPLLFVLTFMGTIFSLIIPFNILPLDQGLFFVLDYLSFYLAQLFQFTATISPGIRENWSILHIFCYYGGILSLFYLLKSSMVLGKLRAGYLSFFTFILLFVFISIFSFLIPYLERDLKVVFLDIGHGDSIYINTPAKNNVLIDGGGVYDDSPARDPGESILVPFLEEEGVEKIDLMVATHPHVDHIGGLREVLKNFDVGTVMLPALTHSTKEYEEFLALIGKEEVETFVVEQRREFYPETNLKLEVLHPEVPYLIGTGSDLNNNSVVIRLTYKENSFLFTGDLEEEGEKRLMSRGVELKSDVLKVGHHGSSTSSTREFLKEVSPEIALISAGRDSSYGFPAPRTLKSLEEKDIFILRTDQWGAVKITSNGKRLSVATFLEEKIK